MCTEMKGHFRFFSFQAAGCNQVLESDEKIDRCGVCDGNGASCKHVRGVYTRQWKEIGKPNVITKGRFRKVIYWQILSA